MIVKRCDACQSDYGTDQDAALPKGLPVIRVNISDGHLCRSCIVETLHRTWAVLTPKEAKR